MNSSDNSRCFKHKIGECCVQNTYVSAKMSYLNAKCFELKILANVLLAFIITLYNICIFQILFLGKITTADNSNKNNFNYNLTPDNNMIQYIPKK